MATCTVSGSILDISEDAVEDVIVRAKILNPVELGTLSLMSPAIVKTTTDSSGDWSLVISQGLKVEIIFIIPNGDTGTELVSYSITIPAASTAEFNSLIGA